MDHQQLIPERDSGRPTPKPRSQTKVSTKPRSRGLKSNENDIDDVISLSSISSNTSGLDNMGFSHDDEPTVLQTMTTKGSENDHNKVKSKYFSSDSENDNFPQSKRHTFAADVHRQFSPDNPKEKDQKRSSSTTWRLENETQPSKQQQQGSLRPKPKPRQIYSDSGASHDSLIQIVSQKSEQSSKSSKKDYTAISIQPNRGDHEDSEEEEDTNSDVPEKLNLTNDNYGSKWKKTPHSILTLPLSSDNEDSSVETRKQSKSFKPDTRIDIETLNNNEDGLEMQVFSTTSKNKGKSVKIQNHPDKEGETKFDKKSKKFLVEEEEDDDSEDDSEEDRVDNKTPEKTTVKNKGPPTKREQRRAVEGMDKFFGVTIHSCDLLPMDPNIIHPVVKVTILNENGSGVVKYDQSREVNQGSSPKTHRERHRSKSDKLEGKRESRASRQKMTSSSSKMMQVAKLTTDCVMPTMTQPCKLSYYLPTFAPNWNELLLFEEPFSHIVHSDSSAILFFEIMDFLPVRGPRSNSRLFNSYHGSEAGWYKVAWGFLKLIGANRVRNVGRQIRLQLFKPESLPSKYHKEGLEIYHWWKLNKRSKISSTLYITVKAVSPPAKTSTSLRTLLTMRKDHLAQAIIESQLKTPTTPRKRGSTTSADVVTRKAGRMDLTKNLPQWTRLEGQSCKVPNKVLKSLPVSQIESLNLTISGNVQCVKFSPCGLKLAAGLDTEELHTVLIFEIPSGKLLCSIRCHHGLIYDLDWKAFTEGNSPIPHSYYLASASADTTATIWEIKTSLESPRLIKKLLHASFVYCVKVHPTRPNLVLTGCFDNAIRIWDIEKVSPSRANLHTPETESVPLILLDRHESFVNCMVFDLSGNHLFVGDGSGCVCDWTTARSPSKKKSWKVEREKTFRESGKNAINSLTVHPNGNRLLVHIRNSCIKLLDLETFLVLHSFSGLVNEKLQIQSCFSPCGNLVLSGSEDATLCVWDADTGSILQFLGPDNHKNCCVTSVHYHPFDHFVVIGLSSAISEPSPILLYTHRSSKIPKIRSVARMVTMTSGLGHQTISNDLTSSYDEDIRIEGGGSGQPNVERGDSSDKFMMIVKKLDAALKSTKRPNHFNNMFEQTIASQTSLPELDTIEKWQQTSTEIPGQDNRRGGGQDKLISNTPTKQRKNDEREWRKPKITSPKLTTEIEVVKSGESYSKSNGIKRPTPVKRKKQPQKMDFHSDVENSNPDNLTRKVTSGGDPANDNVNNNNNNKEEEHSNSIIIRTNVEEPEKDSPESTGQNSRVRQKRRERMRKLYETSEFVD